MNAQPKWKAIANIGDVGVLDYGAIFVLVDTTGQYDPDIEWLDVEDDDGERRYTVYRFTLDPCTWINGILSDNPFHPDQPAWFFDHLATLASNADMTVPELVALFCSDDPMKRALAWREVALYYGVNCLDSDPLTQLKRWELKRRYRTKKFRAEGTHV